MATEKREGNRKLLLNRQLKLQKECWTANGESDWRMILRVKKYVSERGKADKKGEKVKDVMVEYCGMVCCGKKEVGRVF